MECQFALEPVAQQWSGEWVPIGLIEYSQQPVDPESLEKAKRSWRCIRIVNTPGKEADRGSE